MKLHIELTSTCNLKCLACPRTIYNKELSSAGFLNKYIDYKQICKFIKNNIDTVDCLSFIGNFGDPMLHPKLLIIIRYIAYIYKKSNRSINVFMCTNGSKNDVHFWSRLGYCMSKLTKHKVKFCIDNIESSSYNYRGVNCAVIFRNAKAFIQHGGNATWRTILLKSNVHQIKNMRMMSKMLGFSHFAVKPAWNYEDDSYIPYDKEDYKRPSFTKEDFKCPDKNECLYIDSSGRISICCILLKKRILQNFKDSKDADDIILHDSLDIDSYSITKNNKIAEILTDSKFIELSSKLDTLNICLACPQLIGNKYDEFEKA